MRQTLSLAIHHRGKSGYTFTALFVAALLGCALGLPDGYASSHSGPRATRTGALVSSAVQGLKLDGAREQTNDGPTAEQAERVERMIAEFEARHGGSEVKGWADTLAEGVAAGPQSYTFYPQAGTLWQDLFMNNFVDLDPGSGFKDFDCSGYTYNGHNGHDSDIDSFKRQEIGVPIFAALDGMVVDAHDGEFDMNTTGPNVPANYVVLGHGDGHYSYYWHMKKGSVAVSLNQFVPAGTQLGQTGSSGISTAPHLHFLSRYAGSVYEPYAGPCRPGASNWVSQIPIRRSSYARDFAVSNASFNGSAGLPFDEAVRTGSFVTGLRTVYFKVHLGGDMPVNASYRVRLRRPDGTNAFDSPGNFGNGSAFRGGWFWFMYNWSFNVTGTWHILFDLNGQPVAEAPLTVVASADQIVNRPPNPITAAIDASSANPPTPSAVLFCRVNTSLVNEDPDYDIVRYRYQWRVNGALVRDVTSAALSDALPSMSARLDDIVSCSVTPSDGKVSGHEIGASIQIGAPPLNPIDDARTFVRQHYLDFLGREADSSGLAFWTGEIENCGADLQCREVKRINVSAAFFLSVEFQNTGYLVERIYKVAYGDRTEVSTGLVVPVVTRAEFMQDTPLISAGVVVGVGEWAKTLESNKVAFAQTFVQRQRFADIYGALTPEQFVDRLNGNAGGVLTGEERAGLVAELTANNTSAARASVLRRIAEHAEFDRHEKNRAFVLMQYFGYLRRNPNDQPDSDFVGYNFWLGKLNEFGGNYINAELVKAFINSDEYRRRFGQ